MTADDNAAGIPARIVEEQRGMYRVASELPPICWAEVTGRLLHLTQSSGEFPAVGDWVVIRHERSGDRAAIHRLLSRQTKISRRAPESEKEQVMAANVDVGFVLSSLNQDLSLNRLERYVTLLRQGGALPVILLSKADLCSEVETLVAETRARLTGVEVHALSALQKEGLETVLAHLAPGKTCVLLGSSGVGKSTLINSLLGEETQKTQTVREGDGTGRHTTTSRRLMTLPHGGMIIDTPGIREIQLWSSDSAEDSDSEVENAFDDILALSARCRFSNCRHESEPKCAVREALSSGALTAGRYENYLKLLREREFERTKRDKAALSAKNKKLRKPQR